MSGSGRSPPTHPTNYHPLTGLQLGLEAALGAPGADLRAALGDALGTARQLESTVSELLALARDRPGGTQILDIDTLTDLRTRWNGLLAAAGRPLRIVVDRDIPRTRGKGSRR